MSGLKPYCLYEFKISVQDKNNRKSEFSQKIQIRTLQGGIKPLIFLVLNNQIVNIIIIILVPGIVEQIEWHWMNTSSVRITWAEPMKPNGVIIGYHISYTDELHIPPTSWAQLNVSRIKNSLDVHIQ